MKNLLLSLVVAALMFSAVESAPPAVVVTPQPPLISIEEEDRLARGLILQLFSDDAGREGQKSQVIDARRSRMLALRVAEGQSVSPFLHTGPVRAIWRGYLYSELGDVVRFVVQGQGTVKLEINTVSVLEASGELAKSESQTVQLHSGFNRLSFSYESPAKGESTVRLLWSAESYVLEPVPPTVLFHDPDDSLLVDGNRLRNARATFATRGCANCHDTGLDVALSTCMPELSGDTPDLREAGARLRPEWLFEWLLNPATMRNNLLMPKVHLGQEAGQTRRTAADLVAFLDLQTGRPDQEMMATGETQQLIDAGEVLFEDRGCLGCHRFTPPDEADEFNRISLHYTGAKYRPGALARFLTNPYKHYSSSRMPDMYLDEGESQALAGYIRHNAAGTCADAAELASADPTRGATAYVQVGCANCHPLEEDQKLAVRGPSLAVAIRPRGCLAETTDGRGMSPDYSFSDEDRKGLQSFIRSAMPSLLHRVPIEVSQRYVDRFRCNVCHDRDGDPNLLGDVLYEESLTGLPPERVPNITWVGEKLHRQWMENQFAGRLEYRARPWMKLRMPRYPTRAFDLASGLAAEHGIVDLQPLALTTDAKSVSLGHQLTLQAPRGFFCVQCHAVGEQPPAGASDHRGVNFVYVRDRIRRDYFIRWITNPLRLDPGSKMPTFAPDGKMTNIATVYGGDAQRQFAAIWEYLRSLKKQMSEPTTVPRPRAPKPGH